MKAQTKSFVALAFFIIIYLVVTFSIPPDPASLARYNIIAVQSRLLSLTIAIPLLLIWSAAFYGFSSFRRYAELIKQNPDGKPLSKLANGLTVLGFGLPIASITSSLLNFFGRTVIVIFNNYLAIAIALTAYALLRRGGKQLTVVVRRDLNAKHKLFLWIGLG